MSDEQPNTPSQDVQAPDVGSPEPTSDEPKEGSSPSWWQRLFNRGHAVSEEPQPDDGGEQGQPGGASKQLVLSEEELKRRVQAEADRRDYERAQRQKAEERKRLRDEDPFAYAQQDREAEKTVEEQQNLGSFFATVGAHHDRVAIDPLMMMLPASERERIMKIEGAGQGLEGRQLVVNEAIKSLEKKWKAEGEKEAEAKLRRNSAFRKQVMAENRAGFQEPELLPAFSGSSTDKKVSDLLRTYYGLPNAPRHNSAS